MTMPWRFTSWFLVTLIGFLANTSFAEPATQIGVSVKPAYEEKSGWNLEVTITNLSDRPLTVADAYLPWGNRYAMVLAAFLDKRPNTILPLGYPIDDPLFRRTVIPPRASISGRMALSNYFPTLAQAAKDNRILVLWSYQLTSDEGAVSERMVGSFTIPPQ